MGRRVRGGGGDGRTADERVAGALARERPAEGGDGAPSVRQTGWLPSADPWAEVVGPCPRPAESGADHPPDEASPARVGARRAVFEGVVPEPLRQGRWAVSWRAGAAGVVLAGVVAALIAVRTAGAAEVQEVPPRAEPSATASAATTSAPLAVGAGEGAATEPAPAGAAATQAAGVGTVVVVHVVGQVNAPGLVTVPAGSRVADALAGAGGASGQADLARVNLARPVVDGEQVYVPLPGEQPPVVAAVPGTPATAGAAGAAPTGAGQPVNLNTADEAALDGLPGIGEVLAGRILAWRAERGPFTSVDELGEIQGIGDALLGDLASLVTV